MFLGSPLASAMEPGAHSGTFWEFVGRTEVGGGAAYSDQMSEGWGDLLVPVISRERFAVGLHSRLAGGEMDRTDLAVGMIGGLWLERWDTVANVYVYWDHHEFEAGEFDEWVVGTALRTRWGQFQAFGHFAEEGVFTSGTRRVSSASSDVEVFTQTRLASSNGFINTFEDRRTVTTTTRLDEMFSDLLDTGDGFEAEYGLRLPWFDRFGNLSLFAGYQWWDRSVEPIQGFTARLRWELNEHLAFQARYFDDDRILGGVDQWRFEVVGRIPLGRGYAPDPAPNYMSAGKKVVVEEPVVEAPNLLQRPTRVTWPVLGRGQRVDAETGIVQDETQETILLSRQPIPRDRPERQPRNGNGDGGEQEEENGNGDNGEEYDNGQIPS